MSNGERQAGDFRWILGQLHAAETTVALQGGKDCTNKLAASAAPSSNAAVLYHHGPTKQSALSESDKASTAQGNEAGLESLSWAPIFHNVKHRLLLLKTQGFCAVRAHTGPDKHESC